MKAICMIFVACPSETVLGGELLAHATISLLRTLSRRTPCHYIKPGNASNVSK
ncbi:hypothetical protein PF005_g13205 [Phytophthora fragariae]|uniref:Uncharacterized protein n=2 Tax=Phytophthora TaxID=4783 RepID=A0A6A3SF57_9STRA|nr:hypothetical protein PF003_g22962 [Phytophthora fragariae]KAE9012169.1 hypothetical protein PR002_g14885 [Phytophthora rubi]KAE8930798.1 hypothetical protein PF009_g19121 [Phytophthora fragariae]KAE8988434.1 hypothetical protein PF011_g19168 [Phytophthora fragariae]KAE9017545.1 hypothetical protein PR001_g14378 [Phytophthora rubi]